MPKGCSSFAASCERPPLFMVSKSFKFKPPTYTLLYIGLCAPPMCDAASQFLLFFLQ